MVKSRSVVQVKQMKRFLRVLPAIMVLVAAAPAQAHEWVDYFSYGVAALSPRGYQTAREVADYSKRRSVTCLQVVAHMDTMETHDFSTGLSQRRAQAMATELVLLGVDPAMIELDARGAEHLARPTGDRVSEPLNRRGLVNILSRPCAR